MNKKEKNKKARERYKKRLKLKKCKLCNKEFYGHDKQKNCDQHRHKFSKETIEKSKVYKKCKICGKLFYGKNHLCSKECYDKFIENLKNFRIGNCDYCNKQIKIYPCKDRNHKYHFCNKKCYYAFKKNKPNFKIRGKNHPGWKGGCKRRDNSTLEVKRWREKIFKRDYYQCVFCGQTGQLIAHHLIAWADDIILRFYINNGITVCKKCHNDIHKGNFMKPIDYEYTKDKCENKGIRLRKKISDRIEEIIRNGNNNNFKK